ncbi:MAG: rRNA maturation RNase YbeY [Defluviitaleaceae bacterium]|nr:rRNA maturation RNase YbeY [Defluviitaleaceae bacterium]
MKNRMSRRYTYMGKHMRGISRLNDRRSRVISEHKGYRCLHVCWDERGISSLPMPFRVILRQAILEVLRREGKNKDFALDLLFVTVEEICELNNIYRQKDAPTDVLSFPASCGDSFSACNKFIGDIAICVEIAKSQAAEYGHSLERELAFLTVHGLLHLLGYDHETPEDEVNMIKIQEEILTKVGLPR